MLDFLRLAIVDVAPGMPVVVWSVVGWSLVGLRAWQTHVGSHSTVKLVLSWSKTTVYY